MENKKDYKADGFGGRSLNSTVDRIQSNNGEYHNLKCQLSEVCRALFGELPQVAEKKDPTPQAYPDGLLGKLCEASNFHSNLNLELRYIIEFMRVKSGFAENEACAPSPSTKGSY